MNWNMIVVLSFLALAGASEIAPAYSPATQVSYSSFSSGPTIKTISGAEKTIVTSVPYAKSIAPAPIYENTASTSYGTLDGKSITFAKSLDYSSFNNFGSGSIDNSHLLAHSIPVYSSGIHANPIVYHPQTSYGLSSPVYHHHISSPVSKSVSIPVTYTTHTSPLTQTISAPSLSYSTPIVTKTPGLSSFTSHTPLIGSQDVKTITYSDAPVVSHMSFSGLGASYAW